MEEEIQILQNGVVLHNTYVVKGHIASGGFGNTYLVTHNQLNEDMVVKEFFMKGVNYRDSDSTTVRVGTTDSRELFSSQKDKFKKEAQRIWKLRNEHVVKVHDMFEENDTVYYVMDYIDGTSLATMMKQTGTPFTEEKVRDILWQVLDALQVVHKAGVWHMDIKPENIMMDKQGKCVLIDFGSSKQISTAGSSYTSTSITYTPGYAPMEQVEGMQEKWGPWTDFYALGATLYNLLTMNRPPLTLDITSEGDRAFSYPYPVSSQMQQLISYMMQPIAMRRPQTADEILMILAGAIGTNPGMMGPGFGYGNAPMNNNNNVAFNHFTPQNTATKAMSHQRQAERNNKNKRTIYISLIACLVVFIIGITLLLSNSKSVSPDETINAIYDAQARIDDISDIYLLYDLNNEIQLKVDDIKMDLSDEDRNRVEGTLKEFDDAFEAKVEEIRPLSEAKALIKEFTEKCRNVESAEEFEDLVTELMRRGEEFEKQYPNFEPTGADSLELAELQEEFDRVIDEKAEELSGETSE